MTLYSFNSDGLVNIAVPKAMSRLPEVLNAIYAYRLAGLYAVCTYIKKEASSTCYVYTMRSHYFYSSRPYFLSYIMTSLVGFTCTSVDADLFNELTSLPTAGFTRTIFRHSVCSEFD